MPAQAGAGSSSEPGPATGVAGGPAGTAPVSGGRAYRLTADGIPAARQALAEATAGRAKLNARLRPIGETG